MPCLAGTCSKDLGNQMGASMTKLETRLTVLYEEPFWLQTIQVSTKDMVGSSSVWFRVKGRRICPECTYIGKFQFLKDDNN